MNIRIGKQPAPMLANYAELISKGLIVLILKENYLLIENVVVYNLFQGQGIGRRLIEFAFMLGKKEGL